MGTEIVLLFMPVPLLFWARALWQLRTPGKRARALLLLGLGVAFMTYFVLSEYLAGTPVRAGLAVGGFLYAPFHLACSLAIRASCWFWKKLPR